MIILFQLKHFYAMRKQKEPTCPTLMHDALVVICDRIWS